MHFLVFDSNRRKAQPKNPGEASAKASVFIRFFCQLFCSETLTHLALKRNTVLRLKKKERKRKEREFFPPWCLQHPIKSWRIKLPSLSMLLFFH
jgi:hypothetical protein